MSSNTLVIIPAGFATPQIADEITELKVKLGKRLFFDPILSSDSTISCGSCHLPERSFADNKKFSFGVNGMVGVRNAPALINLVYADKFLWDGGVNTLEKQILVPIGDHREMNSSIPEVIGKLSNHAEYPQLIKKAFNREVDAFSLTRALGAFQRTLISGNSKFDKYKYQKQEDVLNESEISGMKLFFSEKTNCTQCHSSFLFTNSTYQNNGLHEFYSDSGRYRITLELDDMALFKVPSLRNCELTAPYMHDGMFQSLEQVVEHYNSGGKDHFNKSKFIKKLHLSGQEKKDLVNFLKTLTDTSFINLHAKSS